MSGQKIGIMDSGVGGLSVLLEIRRLMPELDIHYVGDSAWCPYGTKSPEQICARTGEIVDHLQTKGVSLIVIACNSATIHAVGWLRSIYPIPFVGMEPGVKPACAATRTGVIGVLATEASIVGEKFIHLVDTLADGVTVVTQPCPKFVELVEAGILEGPEVEKAIVEYTSPILEKGADVIVLGCTHYPFLKEAIRARIPDEVTIIDTGEAVARRVKDLLEKPAGNGSLRIETSGNPDHLLKLAPILIPNLIDHTIVSRFSG